MKNFIIVTGGAGFVGTNLIERLLKKTNKKIILQKPISPLGSKLLRSLEKWN